MYLVLFLLYELSKLLCSDVLFSLFIQALSKLICSNVLMYLVLFYYKSLVSCYVPTFCLVCFAEAEGCVSRLLVTRCVQSVGYCQQDMFRVWVIVSKRGVGG